MIHSKKLAIHVPILLIPIFFTVILASASGYVPDGAINGNNSWTVQAGTWAIKGPHITGGGLSARIVSNRVFPSDRTLQVTVTTLSAGPDSWNVAWATGKYIDECNRIILLIHTSGDLEFTYSSSCVSTFNVVYATGLSPFVPHVFKMVFSGNEGKAYIDNVQYFDLTSPIIGGMGNTPVQLVSWGPSQSSFDNPKVS